MKREKTKRDLKVTIDIDLLDTVRPYINNLSSFFESCLKNFYQKNRNTILKDDFKTAKLNIKDLESKDLPNITYITNNSNPVQLKLFDLVDGRVITGKNEKLFTFPTSKEFSFTSNNTILIGKKEYYFEILDRGNESPITKDKEDLEEEKWW